MNTEAMETSYAELIALARQGRFAEPDGGWNAELVLAHLAVGDRMLTAVTQSVLAGRAARFDNAPSTHRGHLAMLADAAGGLSGMIAIVEAQARALVAAAQAMSEERGATIVPSLIVDGEEAPLDGPVAWASLLEGHAGRHLPAHVEQLRAMRKE